MSTLITRDFTASNGTEWPGFTRVMGGAFAATVVSNRGGAGATATERIYRVNAWAGIVNHKVALNLDWLNAAGAGDSMGPAARVSADGSSGYVAQVDSNAGTPRARIRRRVSGSFSDVVAWTNLTGVTATDLNNGVDVALLVETRDGSVSLKLYVDGTLEIDGSDSHVSRIESGGAPGIYIGANPTADDVTADDFTVEDFEAEATGTPSDGTALVLDSVYHDESEWQALGVSVELVRESYDDQPVVSLIDTNPFTSPALYPGMDVAVEIDGTRIATGVLRMTTSDATPQEGTTYEVVGPATLAQEVPLAHPKTGAAQIYYNVDDEHQQYDPDRVNLTIGEIIEDILDNHADGETGLRALGAAPPSDTPYDSAETANLDFVPGPIAVTQNPLAAVEMALSFMPDFARRIDPITKVWHFDQRSAATTKDIDISQLHVEAQFGIDPAKNYTKVRIIGPRQEFAIVTLGLVAGDIAKAWETGLEAEYTAQKQFKNKDSGTVQTSGTDGSGNVYIEPASPFTMAANEWDGTPFELNGDEYVVKENTTARITLTATAWGSGGAPTDGVTTFDVGGGGLDQENNFQRVWKEFALTAATKALVPGACYSVTYTAGTNQVRTRAWAIQDAGSSDATRIRLETSAVQENAESEDPCTAGGTSIADDVQIEGPVFEKGSGGLGTAPVLDVPADGFRGDAFSFDSGKWNGGGEPGYGDAKVRRTYTLIEPGFDGSSAAVTRYTKMANSMLAVAGKLARTARIQIHGTLDVAWAGLARRITFSNTLGTRSLPSWMSSGDLWLLGVEWDVRNKTTILIAGTLASNGYDLGGLRKRFIDEQLLDKRIINEAAVDAFLECVNDQGGGGKSYAGADNPNPIPGCQVTVGGSGTVDDLELEKIECELNAGADPLTPPTCEAECTPSAPVAPGGVTQLLANAQDLDALTSIYDFVPSKEVADVGSNPPPPAGAFPPEVLCCMIKHNRAQWYWQAKLAAALNDLAKKVHDDFTTIFGFISTLASNDAALKTCINLLNACMATKEAGSSSTCWSEDPCEISTSFTYTGPCTDFCSEAPPAVDCWESGE